MLKIVEWDYLDRPELGWVTDTVAVFNDHREQYDLEVGDMIMQLSEDNDYSPACYIVRHIEDYDEQADVHGLKLIYAEAIDEDR